MPTVPPAVPDSHPNVPSTYRQVLATSGSSDNTLRERESSKNRQGSDFDEEQKHKNKNGDAADEEKAQEAPMKPVGFWDPSLAKTRKWVILHWLQTSTFQVQL